MLYTLLTSYGEQMFDLVCKDGVKISTGATALKRKTDVFGFIFDMDSITSYCNSRKLKFIHRIVVRRSLVNCILIDVSLKTISVTTTPISSKQSAVLPNSTEESQSKEKRLKDLKEEITTLNAQLLKKKEAFSSEKIDKEIRKMKKERNGMVDKDDQVLRQELKALRREEYTCRNVCAKTYYYSLKYTSRKQHSDDSVDLPTELKQTRFSGTDYGLKTMSVTVPIFMKMFNTHLNLYNKFHPDNSLPVVKAKEKYLQLPKAFKITAAEINHSSLKNKFQYCIEKQKKNTVIPSIESSLSLLSKEVQPVNVMSLKRYFVAMKERQTLRNFYYGQKISRQRRTLEVKNRTVKDRVTSKERKFVLQGSKTLHPVMAIGNQGLGVGSTIRGYDCRGGKWPQRKHERHATTIITNGT
ncbi:unnamed protein product [Rhizopus microsporus]